jgi:arginase
LSVQIDLIGVPLDLGAGRRGVDMGPSAIRLALVAERLRKLGHKVHDRGNVPVPLSEELDEPANPRAVHAEAILGVCAELERRVAASLMAGRVPVVLGGDHSLSMGSARASLRHRPGAGLLWIDAHGDCNTAATSPSGNVHGMPVAALLGLEFFDKAVVAPERVAMVGIRELDRGEREMLRQHGVHVFTMHEVDRFGMAGVMEQALAAVGERAHISFDLDVLDPAVAPGVGTPVPGGITYREAFLALEMIAEAGVLQSLDIVEVNPILDKGNKTAEVAARLAAAAIGDRIL